MKRPLTDLPAWTAPEGVVVRGFEPQDEAALLEVNATAFAHHPEQGHMRPRGLRRAHERGVVRPRRPAGRGARRRGRRPAAAAGLPLDQGAPRRGAAVRRGLRRRGQPQGRRGRGLGTVLTNAGLEHLASRGLDEVLLYVDGDNDPAVAVYTNQGFHTDRVEVQYRGVVSLGCERRTHG